MKEEIGKYLYGLEEKQEKKKHYIIDIDINKLFINKLSWINTRLNERISCENCKEKEIEKLTGKCGNEEIARLLYECEPNANHYYNKIRWIPFDEFINIEYLAKGCFGEVHKATWIKYYDFDDYYYDQEVVLKRIYNSSDKIVDVLREVKVYY